jgi:hypothetical protein
MQLESFKDDGQGTTTPQGTGTWAEGWTVAMGGDFVLVYNPANGSVRIDTVNGDLSGTTNVWGATWAPGWSSFGFFTQAGPDQAWHSYGLQYNRTTGSVEIVQYAIDTFPG